MEAHIMAQGKNDPPKLVDLPGPVIDQTHNEVITFCVVEAGMQSGEPSVIIVSSDDLGSICLQTSLDKFLMGASGMIALAENQWGWKRPEGHFSLMPPDRETQKALLEAIKKELEQWGEVDG